MLQIQLMKPKSICDILVYNRRVAFVPLDRVVVRGVGIRVELLGAISILVLECSIKLIQAALVPFLFVPTIQLMSIFYSCFHFGNGPGPSQ